MPQKIEQHPPLAPCYQTDGLEAGVDEAGRGPLAGPVVAAAVVLPPGFSSPLLRDSKTLKLEERLAARELILQEALAWGVGISGLEDIARYNILGATYRAMHEAVDQVVAHLGKSQRLDLLLIDGNRYKAKHLMPYVCIVKGDGKYQSIAAAGILAKTTRDEIMQLLHAEYPNYGWATNQGYPTPAHRAAIAEHGPSPYHRKGFRLLKSD